MTKDLKPLGPIDIRFYKSTFSTPSLEDEITHSEPSTIDGSNHVDLILDEKIIMQFFERSSIFSGILYEEHIPGDLQEEIERILKGHGYHVGNPQRMRLLFQVIIVVSFANAFFWLSRYSITKMYWLHKYPEVVVRELFDVFYSPPVMYDIVMGSVFLIIGILWIYRYKKTSFRR